MSRLVGAGWQGVKSLCKSGLISSFPNAVALSVPAGPPLLHRSVLSITPASQACPATSLVSQVPSLLPTEAISNFSPCHQASELPRPQSPLLHISPCLAHGRCSEYTFRASLSAGQRPSGSLLLSAPDEADLRPPSSGKGHLHVPKNPPSSICVPYSGTASFLFRSYSHLFLCRESNNGPQLT